MIRILLLVGCGCFALVMLTHLAEVQGILPVMGWGLPDSPGHYIDLVSGICGVAALAAAAVLRLLQSK